MAEPLVVEAVVVAETAQPVRKAAPEVPQVPIPKGPYTFQPVAAFQGVRPGYTYRAARGPTAPCGPGYYRDGADLAKLAAQAGPVPHEIPRGRFARWAKEREAIEEEARQNKGSIKQPDKCCFGLCCPDVCYSKECDLCYPFWLHKNMCWFGFCCLVQVPGAVLCCLCGDDGSGWTTVTMAQANAKARAAGRPPLPRRGRGGRARRVRGGGVGGGDYGGGVDVDGCGDVDGTGDGGGD